MYNQVKFSQNSMTQNFDILGAYQVSEDHNLRPGDDLLKGAFVFCIDYY